MSTEVSVREPCGLRVPRLAVALLAALCLASPAARGAAADSAGSVTARFEFSRQDLRLARWHGYDAISLAGAELPEDTPGSPWLPAKYVKVLIPAGAAVTGVSAEATEERVRTGVTPVPVQPPVRASGPRQAFVEADAAIYNAAAPLPGRVAEQLGQTEHRRGWSVVPVRLNPVRYLPGRRELTLAREIVLTVSYEKPAAPRRMPRRHGELFRRLVREQVVNPDQPGAEPEYSDAGEGEVSVGTRGISGRDAGTGPCDYLVITSEALRPAFGVLVAQRESFNDFTTEIVTTEWISTNYAGLRPVGGSDEQSKIRECIAEYVTNRQTLFVVLGGDNTIVPDRDCYVTCASEVQTQMPTDLYYAGLDGTWDDDADGVYGEADYSSYLDEGDLGADVFVGRIPVRTAQEVSNYVGKVIGYETRLSAAIVPKLLVGGHELWDHYTGGDRPTDTVSDGHLAFLATNNVTVSDSEMWLRRTFRDRVQAYGWNRPLTCLFDTLTSWDTSQAGDYACSPANMVSRFNEGWNFVLHFTHGSTYSYSHEGGPFNTSSASSLTGLTLFFYSVACSAGGFDLGNPCMSEALLTNPNGGALVYLGSSRYNWGSPDEPPAGTSSTGGTGMRYMREFLELVFRDDVLSVGQAFHEHKHALAAAGSANGSTRWLQFSLNLQGDPALGMITSEPSVDIDHTPLINTYETNTPYEVTARIATQLGIDTNTVALHWATHAPTNPFTATPMMPGADRTFTAYVPAQTNRTDVYYYLSVVTNGLVVTHPSNAPALLHHFEVTSPVDLVVSGAPEDLGHCSPPYGTNTFARGNVIEASAPFLSPDAGTRYGPAGWTGGGSVLPAGTTNACTFVIDENSSLQWQWVVHYSLSQTSSVPCLFGTDTWWRASATAATETVPGTVATNGTTNVFAHWVLDGARMPDPTNEAVNPVTGIGMAGPRVATAVYLAQDEDGNTNGIADWWELRYFGMTNVVATADADGDGASNRGEFLDGTGPHDPTDVPRPPGIEHELPLTGTRGVPAPWAVSAVVTDNHAVAAVALWWNRNSNGWQSVAMPRADGDTYLAAIPAPGTNGDVFAYRIEAADSLGPPVTNGPYSFDVAYAVGTHSPDGFDSVLLRAGSSTNLGLVIGNAGLVPLTWRLEGRPSGMVDDMESGTNNWAHGGPNDHWHLSSRRYQSASNAWYMGDAGDGEYVPSMAAWLDTPAVSLRTGATMVYRQWMDCELDGNKNGYAWDGGCVLIATNGGDFEVVEPVGGYPYKISHWQDPQWPQDAPCFAGTGGWQEVTFDLSDYAEQNVVVRFEFRGDNNTQYEGWYIDDLTIIPYGYTNEWMTTSVDEGTLDPGAATNVVLSFTTEGIDTGDRAAHLELISNDPVAPTNPIGVRMLVRSPPGLVLLGAGDPTGAGDGTVIVSNAVHDIDNERCLMSLEVSTDGGAGWSDAWVAAAQATIGNPSVSNGTAFPVRDIATGTGGSSNRLTVLWESDAGPAPIVLATGVLVRARVWDGIFWSDAVTSGAFVVDNEAPSDVGFLNVTTHQAYTWTTNRFLGMEWGEAHDGSGLGVAGYLCLVTNTPGGLGTRVSTNRAAAVVAAPEDGQSLWVVVNAVDVAGNVGAGVGAGAFRVDTAPPALTGTNIVIPCSDFGPYVVGTTITCTWGNVFADLCGISNYFVSATDGGGTTNGRVTTTTANVMSNLTPGQAHEVYVWACDPLGLIGPAATASIFVLDPDEDDDSDGHLNSEEEIAGTQARSAASRFITYTQVTTNAAGELLVIWLSTAQRLYDVECRDSLSEGGWVPVPLCTNLPGTGAAMIYTGRVSEAAQRFYRVTVRMP